MTALAQLSADLAALVARFHRRSLPERGRADLARPWREHAAYADRRLKDIRREFGIRVLP